MILVALTAVSTWSTLALPRLCIDPSIGSSLIKNAEMRELEEASTLFPDEHLVIVSLPCGDPFSPSALTRLDVLSSALEAAGGGEAWRLYSPTTVETFTRQGEELLSSPLCGPADDTAAVRSRFATSPLFSRLFLSSDGHAWTLLLSVRVSGAALLAPLESLRASFPEIRIAGAHYYSALNERTLLREFKPLLIGSAVILLAIEFLILRAVGPAILLWAFSLLPPLLLLGLFVATGTPMRLQYVLAPVLALSLSNSYVTHMYRGWAEGGCDSRAAVRSRARIVLLDAGTTVLGFGSLFASPVRELAVLGAFSIAGAAFSVAVGLIGLPAALGLVGRPSATALRFAAVTGSSLATPRRPGLRIATWAATCALLGLFALRLESGIEPRDQFLPWSRLAGEARYFDAAYSGLDEASIVVSTGKENGLVDLGTFRALDAIERDLASLPEIGAVYGPTDLVKEALARWEGSSLAAEEPKSDADIGESLELLSSAGGGLFSRGFVDSAWSSAKLRIAVSPRFRVAMDYPILKSRAEAVIKESLPGVTLLWGGDIARNSIEQRAFIKGQVGGGLGFFALLFVGLCLVFRSIPRAFAVSSVPLSGFLACLGVMGLADWRISPVHAIALATIAGTGVDNAIVLVLRGWSVEARDATVDTTVLIVLSMSSLLFCSSYLVVQTAIVCMIGLIASTVTATLVLPSICRQRPVILHKST